MKLETASAARTPELVLVLVSALWGSSFILLSVALESISPALLVALRFGFGALLMAAILRSRLFKLRRIDWIAGCLTGTCIFFGYFLQTVGLQWISSSVSAFLTALYVPFVPLLQMIFLRKLPGKITSAGIAVAFLGMLLIMDPSRLSFDGSLGEWLTVASALACALEIIVIGFYAKQCEPTAFCFTQLVVVSALAAAYCAVCETVRFEANWQLFTCLGILIGMIAFNQYAISWAQKSVAPVRAVLIYTLEPVFAGIIGYCVGERLGTGGFIGCILVIGSVLLSSWLPKYLQQKKLNRGENA